MGDAQRVDQHRPEGLHLGQRTESMLLRFQHTNTTQLSVEAKLRLNQIKNHMIDNSIKCEK